MSKVYQSALKEESTRQCKIQDTRSVMACKINAGAAAYTHFGAGAFPAQRLAYALYSIAPR